MNLLTIANRFEKLDADNIQEALGYGLALIDLLYFLSKLTEGGSKREIDSVDIAMTITETWKELGRKARQSEADQIISTL